jgi:hypothetical protein
MRRTHDVIVHSTCSSSIPSRPTNPSCGRRCLPTETHSIWPNGFWRISAAVVKVCKPDREGTVAETRGNGEVAPIPAVRWPLSEPRESTLLGHSASHSERLFLLRVFGRLPVTDSATRSRAGVRKASGEETAGSLRRQWCRSMGI